MFPAEAIVRASARWLRLLRSSSLAQASAFIDANASYTDLTQTQYASGLDLLKYLDLLTERHLGLELASHFAVLPEQQLRQLLFERILLRTVPAWLPDA